MPSDKPKRMSNHTPKKRKKKKKIKKGGK